MHARVGSYHVRDIRVTSAFDISSHEVGKDLSEAWLAAPNKHSRVRCAQQALLIVASPATTSAANRSNDCRENQC